MLLSLGPARVLADADALRYYDVCLNGRCSGAVAVLVPAPGRWLVEARVLADAGMDTRSWPMQRHDGVDYVDLLARFPQGTVSFVEAEQSLSYTLPGTAWPERNYTGARLPSRPVPPLSRLASAFLNYSLYAATDADSSLYGEAGWVRGGWLLRSSFDFRSGRLRRGLSSLELDQPERQRRWVLGDQYLDGYDPFAAGARLAGIGVQRAYELTPSFSTFPGADIRGVMQAPGSVDVYANGMLVAQQELQAGPFNLQDLVLAQGSNDLRIVVNDPFAGSYELSSDFYGSRGLLREGLHEFDDRLGRVAQFGDGAQYRAGPPLLSLNHRYGLSDFFTAGLRYEQLGERRNIGASFDLRPVVGSFSGALAHSRDSDGRTGLAWRADYSYQGRRMGFALGAREQDAGYLSVLATTTSTLLPVLRQERYGQASWPIGRHLSIGVRLLEQDFHDGRRRRFQGANLAWRSGRVGMTLGASRRRGEPGAGDEVFFNLRLPLGRESFGVGASHRDGAAEYRLAAQRSPPADHGWGYRVDMGRRESGDSIRLGLDQVSRIGRAMLSVNQFDGYASGDVRYSGGLLWTLGEFFPTQPGASAYALVRTAGTPGVPVLRENQRIGVTGKNGTALVPGIQPYQSNLIGIDVQKLGAQQQADQEAVFVNAPRYGVGLAEFRVRTVHAAQAFLGVRRNGGWQRFTVGEVRLVGAAEASAIGQEGQVYFDDLPPGAHLLQVRSGNIDYRCELRVPVGEAMAWLGEITCVPH